MTRRLILIFYNVISLPIYIISLPVLYLVSSKFRETLHLRFKVNVELKEFRDSLPESVKVIWIHSASMGEFEQARPLIAELKKQHSELKIVATFMSVSGYEARKNYPNADKVSYIPLDFFFPIVNFYSILRPVAGIIIRYEFWPNLVLVGAMKEIPLYLICASLKKNNIYSHSAIKWFFKPVMNSFKKILTVNETHTQRFVDILGESAPIQTTGDTRFDQVINRSQQLDTQILNWKRPDKFTFIIGSSWPDDEYHIFPAFSFIKNEFPNVRLIIVPHEIHPEHIDEITTAFSNENIERYSDVQDDDWDILWVDAMGKLMSFYSIADAAYVGGGFGHNIHNILEPAVYGIPIAHGPRFSRSPEAIELLRLKLTTVITNEILVEQWMRRWLTEKENYDTVCQATKEYVLNDKGITKVIVQSLELDHL